MVSVGCDRGVICDGGGDDEDRVKDSSVRQQSNVVSLFLFFSGTPFHSQFTLRGQVPLSLSQLNALADALL